jgi:MFS superfamily sulfate permease-like transporter
MPVVTGLYTMLVPMAVFALLGSSRHLVVAADSATAAILAAGLVGVAGAGSPRYVQLAGTAALLVGELLLVARLVRLGFLADFLSRTVLVGFLTGVGIQVSSTQLTEMLGVHAAGSHVAGKLIDTLKAVPHTNAAAALVSFGVIVLVVGMRWLTRRVPGALIAVVGAITVSQMVNLAGHGVVVLGAISRGHPHLAVPSFALPDLNLLLPTAVSMFVVIVAQSSATRGPTRPPTTRLSARTATWSAWPAPTCPLRSPAPSSSTAAPPRRRWSMTPVVAANSPS